MIEIKAMTYEESRHEYFEEQMRKAQRRIKYWDARIDRSRPHNMRDPAAMNASDAGWEYNFYKDALEALAAQPKWISVDERLPDENKPVLVFDEYNGVGISFHSRYTNSFVGLSKDVLFGSVTHWMPLPTPPDTEQ